MRGDGTEHMNNGNIEAGPMRSAPDRRMTYVIKMDPFSSSASEHRSARDTHLPCFRAADFQDEQTLSNVYTHYH